ncbi:MAG: glycerol-3-phosphate dehydrogenase/oxidase [Anaerolineae bacterium]|nr:glycerol-3-phosphate dehydrogenase/oxidase [Anaerolineae bacterium]
MTQSELVDRESLWSVLDQNWDVIVIGGGITGAGILRLAVQSGLKTILFEANDFAYGTSSRSSKLVHGGLRYLKNGQINVTHESVCERDRMLREAPDLVSPLRFIIPNHSGGRSAVSQYRLGVIIYDLLGRKWQHGSLTSDCMAELFPQIDPHGLLGGLYYYDAETDDARLVLRLMREALARGGVCMNYTPVIDLLKTGDGQVCGVRVQDRSIDGEGRTAEVCARAVINATGPWTDELRAHVAAPSCLRKLRGSHLVFPSDRLHVPCAMTMIHPRDRRTMFIIPWQGVTVVGTTDLDHPPEHETRYAEPRIQPEEVDYILEALQACLPGACLQSGDILSTFAGLRPIVSAGGRDPSKESRAHVILVEDGLVTITGGKLTTYRVMAHSVLRAVQAKLPHMKLVSKRPLFDRLGEANIPAGMLPSYGYRTRARYGDRFLAAWDGYPKALQQPMPGLPYTWAELDWVARYEAVVHLDDLWLRRLRVGLLAPHGGVDLFPGARNIVQPALRWDDARWSREEMRYRELWYSCYDLP